MQSSQGMCSLSDLKSKVNGWAAIYVKGVNFCDLQLSSLGNKTLSKRVLHLKKELAPKGASSYP